METSDFVLPVPDGGGDQRWKAALLAEADMLEAKLRSTLCQSDKSTVLNLVNLQQALKSVQELRKGLEGVVDENNGILFIEAIRYIFDQLDEHEA